MCLEVSQYDKEHTDTDEWDHSFHHANRQCHSSRFTWLIYNSATSSAAISNTALDNDHCLLADFDV